MPAQQLAKPTPQAMAFKKGFLNSPPASAKKKKKKKTKANAPDSDDVGIAGEAEKGDPSEGAQSDNRQS